MTRSVSTSSKQMCRWIGSHQIKSWFSLCTCTEQHQNTDYVESKLVPGASLKKIALTSMPCSICCYIQHQVPTCPEQKGEVLGSFLKLTFQFLPLLQPAAASNSGGVMRMLPGARMLRWEQQSPSCRTPASCLHTTFTSLGTCGWRPMIRQDALLGTLACLAAPAMHCIPTVKAKRAFHWSCQLFSANMHTTAVRISDFTRLLQCHCIKVVKAQRASSLKLADHLEMVFATTKPIFSGCLV